MTARYHRARAYMHVAAMVICALALGTARDEGREGMAALAAATMGGNAVLAAVDWHNSTMGDGDE